MKRKAIGLFKGQDKNQNEVKRNLMSSPIQSLGKVSMLSAREESMISRERGKAREDFLRKRITIKREAELE